MRQLRTWIAVSLFVLCISKNSHLHAQQAVSVAADYAKTASVVKLLQNDDGGFASEKGGASSVGATNSAVRVL